MKYFIEGLIKNDCFDNDHDKRWQQNLLQYWDNFENIKKYFPIRFVNAYKKDGFHDYSLEKIEYIKHYTKSWAKINILIYLSYDNHLYHIEYLDVSKFKFENIITDGAYDNDWLYSEVLMISDNLFSHEAIICDNGKLYIEFKKLKFKKLK